jgi:ParB-like chromosome segregation protein Spo0J
MADTRRIEYRAVRDLQPDDRNPKTHDLKTLGASVTRFGYIEPVVLDERTGRILAGHGRTETLSALEAQGGEPPEGVVVEDGIWQVPVVVGWASADDNEAAAALIALNRTTEIGGWDDSVLDLLTSITETELGLDGIGFTEADVDRMLRLQEALGESLAEAQEEWTKAGLADLGSEDKSGVYHVHVSFASMDDYKEFRRRLDLESPPRTRIWFPEQPVMVESGTHLVAMVE